MANITLGLSSIKGKAGEPTTEADIFKDTGYTDYGHTYQDTAKMSMEDDTVTEFYCEEQDDPLEEIIEQGKILFNFSIMDPTIEMLQRLFGGNIDPSANPTMWKLPDTKATIEESVIITPKKGLAFHIPRGVLKAKLAGDFSKKSLLLLECTVTARKPKTKGLRMLYAKKVVTTT